MSMEARTGRFISFFSLLFLSALVVFSFIPDYAAAIPQIVDIEEELSYISVGEDSTGELELNVSIRSPSNQNNVFLIGSELKGGTFWSAEHTERIYLEPFEEWEFVVTVFAPAGEMADKEVELVLRVTSENGVISGEDSCNIRVLPFLSTEISAEEEYLIDMPREGSFNVNLKNTGNVEVPVGMISEGFLDTGDDLWLDPGENVSVRIDYDLTELDERLVTTVTSATGTKAGNSIGIEFFPDGDRLQILFGRGPFLILLPGLDERDSVKVFCLGGELSNVGVEVVGGDDGFSVGTEKGLKLNSLDREELSLRGKGFSGMELLELRAYGYDGDERVTSNIMIVPVTGESRGEEGIDGQTLIYAGGGTAAAGITLMGTIAYLYSASEVFKYRWLLLAFIPLYSTVHGEKVLDHFFRGRLFEYIKEHPGATFTALKEHFEVNNGTLTYHLHKLEKEEIIVHRNMGKYKLFYVDGLRIKGVEAVISPVDREIIDLISTHPGISSKEIMNGMSEDRSGRTISRHIKQLERKGFITSDRRNGTRVFFITGDLERVLLPNKGVVEVSEITGLDA